jgi:lysozyme family protein
VTAANFPPELGDELVFEGGFVDNPQDPGGATDFGITLGTLSHWLGRPASIAELKALTPGVKSAIYRALFWNVIQGDELPGGVDLEVFDMAVNGGPKRAVEILQGCLGGLVVDGVLGQKTLGAVQASPRLPLISLYAARRQAYYRGLSTFGTFGAGWLARVAKCETEAMALPP